MMVIPKRVNTSSCFFDEVELAVEIGQFGHLLIDGVHDEVKETESPVGRLGIHQRIQRLKLKTISWTSFAAVEVIAEGKYDFQQCAQLLRRHQRARG